jgi:branched-chain amino acid transport system permease protein
MGDRRTSGTGSSSQQGELPYWLRALLRPVRWRHVVVAALLLAYPFFASPFFTFQIGAQSLALGLIALSLTFLGGSGGMVSLAQMTIAGMAAYLVAIFGTSSNAAISLAGRGGSPSCLRWRSPPCSRPRWAGFPCAPRASTPS